jgi:N-methylhydantoinase B/oxoprolinase/acetone carboxylase alpha subunit
MASRVTPEGISLEPVDVEEAAEFRVKWMAQHLAEARSPYDLREHFKLQAAKAREIGDKLETAVNVEAAVKVINALNVYCETASCSSTRSFHPRARIASGAPSTATSSGRVARSPCS